MKRLALLLLLCATQALAADPFAYQATRKTSRYERVAVLRPSRWDVLGANVAGKRREMIVSLGTIWQACRDRGLEVHFYDTAPFEATASARDLWENMGSRYAVTVVLYPSTSVAGFARYVCADSTNTNVIVVGDDNVTSWRADTTVRGFMDTMPTGGTGQAASATNQAFCNTTLSSRSDTLWGNAIASGRRKTAIGTGVTRVVRYLNPGTRTGTTFIQNADSVNSNMPGVVSGVPGDTVAAEADYLGPMWKVVFDKNLEQVIDAQGAIDASLLYTNTLDSALCPREVSWVKFCDGETVGNAYPQLLWALIARFTTAKPLRWAYDADDIVDKFTNNLSTPERWSNAVAKRLMRDTLAAYSLNVGTQMNPEHAAAYMRGENPRYESVWSGERHTYLKGMTWVHHAHDSTNGQISSSLTGSGGGYSSGNGGTATLGGVPVATLAHRYASRDSTAMDAGAGAGPHRDAAGNYFGPGNRWGIVQRMAWSDSVRKRVCPECPLPPYLTFPANLSLPVGYRPRPTTSNPLWTYYFSAHATCPPESLLWAYHTGLKLESGQTMYLRMAVDSPRSGTSAGTWIGTHWQWDRDSLAASSMFLYPNERYTVRGPAGENIQAVSVGSFLNGNSAWSSYVANAASRTAKVLGLKSLPHKGEQADLMIGQDGDASGTAFLTDFNGSISNAEGGHDHTYKQSTRVIYNHPLNGQETGPISNPGYEFECTLRGVFAQIRLLSTIAGRPATLCVPAWQVYE